MLGRVSQTVPASAGRKSTAVPCSFRREKSGSAEAEKRTNEVKKSTTLIILARVSFDFKKLGKNQSKLVEVAQVLKGLVACVLEFLHLCECLFHDGLVDIVLDVCSCEWSVHHLRFTN